MALVCFVCTFVTMQQLLRVLVRAQTNSSGAQLSFQNVTPVSSDQTFTIGVGLVSLSHPVGSVDAVVNFNSDLLEVTSVAPGNTHLQTLLPTNQNGFDLNSALKINQDNPTQSQLTFSLLSFDQVNSQVNQAIQGIFDPVNNPIAVITFKAKAAGQANLKFKYDGAGITTDSNVISADTQTPVDILTQPSVTTVTVLPQPTGEPTPFPVPTTTPSPIVNPVNSPSPTESPSSRPEATIEPSPIVIPSPSVEPSSVATGTVSPLPEDLASPIVSSIPSTSPQVSPSPDVSLEATLSLIFEKEPVLLNQEFNVEVVLETKTEISGVDARVLFDPRKLIVEKVTDTHLLPETAKIESNNGNGEVNISQVAGPGKGFIGRGNLAIITFKPIVLGEQKLEFDFSPDAKNESNVITSTDGKDILTQPKVLKFTVSSPTWLRVQISSPAENNNRHYLPSGVLTTVDDTVTQSIDFDSWGLSQPININNAWINNPKTYSLKVKGFLRKRFSLTPVPGRNLVNLDLKAGDLNDDGIINTIDLASMYNQWFKAGSADLNRDDIVNSADYFWLVNKNFLSQDE